MIRLLVFTSLLLLIAARPPEETNEIEAIPSAQPTPDYKKLYNLEKKKNLKNAATAPTTSTTDSSLVEYHINHEISQPSAKEAAREINLEDLSTQSPGCGECTKKEMEYCSGLLVMSDHCCCDKTYFEAFPYVPHTCYWEKSQCKPYASDCGEYMRLRDCCCNKHLSTKWKARLSGGSNLILSYSSLTILFLYVYIHRFVIMLN